MGNNKLKTVDLFCGVGGLGYGLHLANFNIVASYDYWDKAIDVYNENFPHQAKILDLSNVKQAITVIKKDCPEVIIGGPPCQDFSSAGKRVENSNAQLTTCFAEIVCSIKPKIFIMENVARARLSESYSKARALFKQCGYGLTEAVLDASRYNTPQIRKRFFCIGIMNSSDQALLSRLDEGQSKKQMTIADYFKGKLGIEFYYRHPRNYSRRAVYSVYEPSPTIRGVNRPVPINYPGHRLDAGDAQKARPLTTQERSMVQTFPKNWKWIGTKTNIEQMIGNAVPVNLARFVATSTLEHMNNA